MPTSRKRRSMAAGDMSTLDMRGFDVDDSSRLDVWVIWLKPQVVDVREVLRPARHAFHFCQTGSVDHRQRSILPLKQLPLRPHVLQNAGRQNKIQSQKIGAFKLVNAMNLARIT